MTSYTKNLERYVNQVIRSNSLLYYRLWESKKGYSLFCNGPAIYEDDDGSPSWTGNYEHRFKTFVPKREIVKALRLIKKANGWLVESNCLPEEFGEFQHIKALSIRKQEGITPFGKKISSWMVLTKKEDEFGAYYSNPYSNCFKTQEQAFRRAQKFMQLVQHVNSKVEVILESPVNGNDFWRNQDLERFNAYEAKQAEREGASGVQTP